MAGSRPSAVMVSSTTGTVVRAERSVIFRPPLRRREGKRGRKRNFLEAALLTAELVVDIGSIMRLAGYAGSVHLTLCFLRFQHA